MTWPDLPSDPTRRIEIGPDGDGSVGGAAFVRAGGEIIGVYLDDTTPDLDKWREIAVAHYPPPRGMVIVMISMSHPTWRNGPIPPVLNVHEYYPINSGEPMDNWVDHGFPPGRQGYCGQRNFPGYASLNGGPKRPPNALQRAAIKEKCLAQHPRLYLEY